MDRDAEIKREGMRILREKLGLVDAVRFIAMIKRNTFDYTAWQANLWEDKTVDEIFDAAEKWEEGRNTDQEVR